MVGGDRSEDLDVIGVAEDDLEAAVQVFFVRKGRVVGRKGFIIDKVEDLTPGELTSHILEGLYDDPPLDHPKQVLVPTLPDDVALYEGVPVRAAVAAACRSASPSAARRCSSRRRSRTTRKDAFARHRLKRAGDHNARARALNELQEHLGLPEAPPCGSSATT